MGTAFSGGNLAFWIMRLRMRVCLESGFFSSEICSGSSRSCERSKMQKKIFDTAFSFS